MGTIKEVADRAKVSVGTVSNVLSGTAVVSPALRARVERAVRELNYHPNHIASSLKSRRTKTFGIVVSDITNPFFPRLVRGAEDAALKHGYMLTIFNTDDRLDREREVFSALRSRRVDGVLAVVAPNPQGQSKHLTETVAAGVPVVCLDRMPEKAKVDAVLVDNVKGALICVRHLIAMGHKEIGFISGAPGLQTARERLKGYEMALSEANIEVDSHLIREGDFRFEGGYRAAKSLLLERSRPTALFIANGTMGLGAVKAAHELRLVCPDDIALAIFDEIPGADILRPNLTVVAQPVYEVGYKAAELLIARVKGELTSSQPVAVKLEPELIIRESTAIRVRL